MGPSFFFFFWFVDWYHLRSSREWWFFFFSVVHIYRTKPKTNWSYACQVRRSLENRRKPKKLYRDLHKYELSCMNTHQNSISSVYYFILRMYQFLLTIYSYLYTIHYITSSKNASLAKPFKNFVFSQCIFQLSDNFFNFIVTLYITNDILSVIRFQ